MADDAEATGKGLTRPLVNNIGAQIDEGLSADLVGERGSRTAPADESLFLGGEDHDLLDPTLRDETLDARINSPQQERRSLTD